MNTHCGLLYQVKLVEASRVIFRVKQWVENTVMSKCSDVPGLYLQGHQDEVFVLEAHPTDPRILLSAGVVHYLSIIPSFP